VRLKKSDFAVQHDFKFKCWREVTLNKSRNQWGCYNSREMWKANHEPKISRQILNTKSQQTSKSDRFNRKRQWAFNALLPFLHIFVHWKIFDSKRSSTVALWRGCVTAKRKVPQFLSKSGLNIAMEWFMSTRCSNNLATFEREKVGTRRIKSFLDPQPLRKMLSWDRGYIKLYGAAIDPLKIRLHSRFAARNANAKCTQWWQLMYLMPIIEVQTSVNDGHYVLKLLCP